MISCTLAEMTTDYTTADTTMTSLGMYSFVIRLEKVSNRCISAVETKSFNTSLNESALIISN